MRGDTAPALASPVSAPAVPECGRQHCCWPRTSQGGLLDAEGRGSDLQDAEVRRNLVTNCSRKMRSAVHTGPLVRCSLPGSRLRGFPARYQQSRQCRQVPARRQGCGGCARRGSLWPRPGCTLSRPGGRFTAQRHAARAMVSMCATSPSRLPTVPRTSMAFSALVSCHTPTAALAIRMRRITSGSTKACAWSSESSRRASTNDTTAAPSRILTRLSSNCSRISFHSGVPSFSGISGAPTARARTQGIKRVRGHRARPAIAQGGAPHRCGRAWRARPRPAPGSGPRPHGRRTAPAPRPACAGRRPPWWRVGSGLWSAEVTQRSRTSSAARGHRKERARTSRTAIATSTRC